VTNETDILHGVNCPKRDHDDSDEWARSSHRADDDGPVDLGGAMYCGRCHVWLNPMDREQVVA
jgi:hypothetical protein